MYNYLLHTWVFIFVWAFEDLRLLVAFNFKLF